MKYPDERARRARREQALSRPDLRQPPSEFVSTSIRMPADGRRCRVRAKDRVGEYALPFDAVYRGGKWYSAKHDPERVIEVQIVGWRYA